MTVIEYKEKAMALINRFSRLFTADMHAVIDRMEEPDILLKQALRDMEAAIAATGQRARQFDQQAQALNAAYARAGESLNDLTTELEVCLEADNDDLARSVIRRKLQTERHMLTLVDERDRIARQLDECEQLLHRQQTELGELQQKADIFNVADVGGVFHGVNSPAHGETINGVVSGEDVEVALLKEKQRRTTS